MAAVTGKASTVIACFYFGVLVLFLKTDPFVYLTQYMRFRILFKFELHGSRKFIYKAHYHEVLFLTDNIKEEKNSKKHIR